MRYKKKPKVTVVVPVFNAEKDIEGCVESLLKQTYEDYEVLLIDDCSTDKTYHLMKQITDRYRGAKVKRNMNNLGAAITRNIGIREVKGEYVAFTDSDCVVDVHWLNELVKCLVKNGGKVAGGEVRTPRNINYFARCVGTLHKPSPKLISKVEAEDIPTCNSIFKKSLLLKLSGFDESFKFAGGEDTDLCARIRLKGIPIYYAPQAIVWHYHKNNFVSFVKWRFRSGIGLSKFAKKHFFKNKVVYNLFNLFLLPFLFLIVLLILLFKPSVLLLVFIVAYFIGFTQNYTASKKQFKLNEICFGVILDWVLRVITSLGFWDEIINSCKELNVSRKRVSGNSYKS